MGFKLNSENILITWEPGRLQKRKEEIQRQNIIFERFAEMLPEMIYEVDITGKILYANTQGLKFFGYTKEDLVKWY